MKEMIKKIINFFDVNLVKFLKHNGFLASTYYLLGSRRFYREHKAVLTGRLRYQQTQYKAGALLRRNTHRLEKGLSMQDRRSVFALGYIEDTVQAYCSSNVADDNESLKWSHDVLKEYFRVVQKNDFLESQKGKFETSKNYKKLNKSEVSRIPKKYKDRKSSLQNFESLVKARCSVRTYENKRVSRNIIDECIGISSNAPSACNRQPFKYYVIDNKKDVEEIAGYAMGTGGFAENLPGIIVVTGDLSYYPHDRDRHVIYIDASLSSMLLMLALKSKGLDSCPINWPDIESREKKMQSRLGLPIYERPVLLIGYGYADEDSVIPYSQKKPVNELREYIA